MPFNCSGGHFSTRVPMNVRATAAAMPSALRFWIAR